MLACLRWLVVLAALFLVIAAGLYRAVHQPLQLTGEWWVKSGTGSTEMAAWLHEAGVPCQPCVRLALAGYGRWVKPLQAGEYRLEASQGLWDLLQQMGEGRVIARSLTIPEGLSLHQILALVADSPYLQGDVPQKLREGRLLPETYHITRGETRAAVVARMQAAMDAALAEAWQARAADVPLKTADELLVLASIVEKETGVASERPLVAGVFSNRLKRGMMLQTDPTVIYAVTDGRMDLQRPLTRADLAMDHPFNTYRIPALPPAPIACPGKAALMAAAQPAATEALYFVADGTGGHRFAATLAEHNRNVAHWRRVERSLLR